MMFGGRKILAGLGIAGVGVLLIQPYTITSAPPALPDLIATPVSDTEVVLRWERLDGDERGVTVWRAHHGGAFAPLATLPPDTSTAADASCYPGVAYTYKVAATHAPPGRVQPKPVTATTAASYATLPPATKLTANAHSPSSISLRWTDPSTGYRNWLVERSTDGEFYALIAAVGGAEAAAGFMDSPVQPTTAYYYRLRQTSGSGYSDYTVPCRVTTPPRPSGAPGEPTDLAAIVNSGTSVTLRWHDTNCGAAAYIVETAQFSWSNSPTWTRAAVTGRGASSYVLRTTPERFYYTRIRARTPAGESGNTAAVVFRTASVGKGTPETYEIGPDKAHKRLADVDWSALGPGDTVYILPNRDSTGAVIPYHEKPLLSTRGTADAPIRIVGVKDPATGLLPIVDGTNAVAAPQWASHYLPLEDLSLVLIGTRANNNSDGWSPGYIQLSNLEIRGAQEPRRGTSGTFQAHDSATRPYATSYGIYIEKGDHITISGCKIHDNVGGVFGAGQGDHRNLEDTTLEGNHIYDNGKEDSYLEHNTYLEGINTVYEFNRYGALRSGSRGGALKDRGAGTIIRYNSICGGARLLDLVETQNYLPKVIMLPSYRETHVYGNVFTNPADTASLNAIHYGGDQGVTAAHRKGTLHFYGNTFVNQANRSQAYRVAIFDLTTDGETLDARNNIFCNMPLNGTPSDITLLRDRGSVYLGRNWLSHEVSVGNADRSLGGYINGTTNLIRGDAGTDPGFVQGRASDFRLRAGSPCIDQAGPLRVGVAAVAYEIDELMAGKRRSVIGAAADLGAFEWRP
jgi:hypothetical protein